MHMHGQSVLYGADGEAKLAWHKYSPERAFSADFVEGLVNRVKDQGYYLKSDHHANMPMIVFVRKSAPMICISECMLVLTKLAMRITILTLQLAD